MTPDEANKIRKATADLYWRVRTEYFKIYYKIYNHAPPADTTVDAHITDILTNEDFRDPFDAYIQSRWDESALADDFHSVGAVGTMILSRAGWNPTKKGEEASGWHFDSTNTPSGS